MGWRPGDDDVLFEREAEISQLDRILRMTGRGQGSVTVLDGPAGVGKTTLLRKAKDLARGLGLRTLSAWCGEMEMESPFGVVRQLFSAPLAAASPEERANLLEGAAQLATPVLVGSFDAPVSSTDPIYSTLHGLYWLASNLAEHGPLLVAVDDAQWADVPSLRFLAFLSRRLDELPLALLLAARLPGSSTAGALLATIMAEGTVGVLRPSPLGVPAVRSMVSAALGMSADEPFAQACHQATGGNPFLLRELVYELSALGIVPSAAGSARVHELAPTSVARAVQSRIGGLPPEAEQIAAAVAILGENADLRHAAELADVAMTVAARGADALVGAGILRPGRPLRFVHPIVAAAIHAELTGTDRGEGHRRAADLLVREGAPLDQIAAHLLLTDPRDNPEVVALLRDAARQVLARGAPEAAASWLRRALDETRSTAIRADVLAELCIAEARMPLGDSFAFLRRGLATTRDPLQRATIALELAHVIGMVADMEAALSVLGKAVADIGAAEGELAREIEAEYITVARLHPSTRASALARLEALRDRADPTCPSGSVLLANLALTSVEQCRAADQAAEFALGALKGGFLVAEDRWVLAYAANTLMWSDRTQEAKEAWGDALAGAQRRGSVTMFMLACTWRSHLACRQGDIPEAEADARLALNAARTHGWDFSLPYPLAFLVDALVEQGSLGAATRALADAACAATLHYLLAARGRLRCAEGRWSEGLVDLLECGRRLEPGGEGSNPAVIPWRSMAAFALDRLGRTSEARALAEEELALAVSFGAPRALGVARTVQALLNTGEERIDGLKQAAELLKGSGAWLEYARTRAARGAALRAAGRNDEAAEDLRESLQLADHCGAHGLRTDVHDALMAMGLRPRRFAQTGVASLTPTEHRVAKMAAGGVSNREIGQTMFVSLKTVEAHLSSAYRKLSINSRSGLALTMRPGADEGRHAS